MCSSDLTLVRFADDAVIAVADFRDAKRVLDVLGKRLARYELTLHPDKTRFVDFRNNRPDGKDHPATDGTTFTFLGFCVLQRHIERRLHGIKRCRTAA